MRNFVKKLTKGFTTINNEIFRDQNLGLKEIGLLTVLLSLPDDWEFNIRGLCKILKDGESAISTALNRLIDLGYVDRPKQAREGGRFVTTPWTIYDRPHKHGENDPTPRPENPGTENPDTEKLSTDSPSTENPAQINNNGQNTDEKNKQKEMNKPPMAVAIKKSYLKEKSSKGIFLSVCKEPIAIDLQDAFDYVCKNPQNRKSFNVFGTAYDADVLRQEFLTNIDRNLLDQIIQETQNVDFNNITDKKAYLIALIARVVCPSVKANLRICQDGNASNGALHASERNNKIHNFTERKYDFSELEKEVFGST